MKPVMQAGAAVPTPDVARHSRRAACLLAVSAALSMLLWPGAAVRSADTGELLSRFYVALAALDAGDNPRAKEELTKLTGLAPDEAAAWSNLGLAEFRLGGLEAANAALARAGELAPGSADIEALRAILEQHRGRPAESRARLGRALGLDPGHVKARYMLVQALQRSRDPDPAQLKAHLEALLAAHPQNLVLLLQRSRIALAEDDAATLAGLLDRLEPFAAAWTGLPKEQFDGLEVALAASDVRMATRRLSLLSNVLKPEPAYRGHVAELQSSTGTIADPIRVPFELPALDAAVAAADAGLAFAPRALDELPDAAAVFVVAAWLTGEAKASVFVASEDGLHRRGDASPALGFRGGREAGRPSRSAVAAFDWNHDFRTDFLLAGAGGLRLFAQNESGDFRDVSDELGLPAAVLEGDYHGAWPVDLEADGDLDVVIAPRRTTPAVLRNNGDGTMEPVAAFAGLPAVRDFTWSDLDGDGDPDAGFVDAAGRLHVQTNQRGGRFAARPVPQVPGSLLAVATGDIDADGTFDLVLLDDGGRLMLLSDRDEGDDWSIDELARWRDIPAAGPVAVTLQAADVDLNGAMDVVVAAGARSRILLRGAGAEWIDGPDFALTDLADVNDDGRLDALGVAAGGKAVWAENSGTRAYGWQVIRLAANRNAGDQRINSMAIGTEIEIRSGLHAQRRLAAGRPVHFGLGERRLAEVARIVWPNGAVQTAYDLRADTEVMAEQRLKGSCPFVFAYDGASMRFVTDFLWRSPLGLRINAQDTAGQLQTEDWVRIDGAQLEPRDGVYDLRITAELWETHFFDHVSLLVVDHPADREVFVDERFVHPQPPLMVTVTTPPTPLTRVWDHLGSPVADRTRRRDGRFVDTFSLGRFQGIAETHWIEAELGNEVPDEAGLTLVANGWVYPTDSSLNVAIGQGDHDRPHGVTLEVIDANGRWHVARPNLGFPAGKNKTVLIGLDGVFRPGAPRRFRLRTNLEIYWDSLAWALQRSPDELVTERIAPGIAELRYRGFSTMRQESRRAPDLPAYSERLGGAQRWRDLQGFHTRFGDVRELLAAIDDRYVIMNAGDELVFEFPAPPQRDGWQRTFVLIGDGWVKDGDFNTVASKTVLPLPHHGQSDYRPGTGRLEDDPVYRRFPTDWLVYHTRYVAPDRFRRGLRP